MLSKIGVYKSNVLECNIKLKRYLKIPGFIIFW